MKTLKTTNICESTVLFFYSAGRKSVFFYEFASFVVLKVCTKMEALEENRDFLLSCIRLFFTADQPWQWGPQYLLM